MVVAGQDGINISDARPLVADTYLQTSRGAGIDKKFGAAAAGVLKSVARQFRNGRGDTYLILGIEFQQLGDLARPAAPGR